MENNHDPLEQFVHSHREAFDHQEAPESSWPVIEQSLPRKKKQVLLQSVAFWRAAALLCLGLSISLIINRQLTAGASADPTAAAGFSDLESYYSTQITEKMALVTQYQTRTGLTEDEITQNLKKLEAMYQVLKDEMKKRPSQDVRDALVLNLLVRIDLINQQLQKLDQPTETKKHKEV